MEKCRRVVSLTHCDMTLILYYRFFCIFSVCWSRRSGYCSSGYVSTISQEGISKRNIYWCVLLHVFSCGNPYGHECKWLHLSNIPLITFSQAINQNIREDVTWQHFHFLSIIDSPSECHHINSSNSLLKGSASNNDVMMTDLQKKLGLFLYGTG